MLEISREKTRGSDESHRHKSKKDSGCDESFIVSDEDSPSPK